MREQTLKSFEEHRIVAFIRSSITEVAEEMIKAAIAGGIRIFEISTHTPQVFRLIENFSKDPNLIIGAGNVTDGEIAQRVINAGVRFVANYYTDPAVITVAKNNDCFIIQGALSPTELVNAHRLGADLIRIFPVQAMGGVNYLQTLRVSFPFVKLLADGDISPENLTEHLKFSSAVSVNQSLFDKLLLRSDNWPSITEKAKQFTEKLETLKLAK